MASKKKNLSEFKIDDAPDLSRSRIGIIVSEWNPDVTNAMSHAGKKTLLELGAKKKNLITVLVPGSFELVSGAKMLLESKKMDAVICIGCVIQGETRHFEFISKAVAYGIMDLNVRYNVTVIFGVLTTDTMKQALERAGGKQGNKGVEAAVAAVKMIALKKRLAK